MALPANRVGHVSLLVDEGTTAGGLVRGRGCGPDEHVTSPWCSDARRIREQNGDLPRRFGPACESANKHSIDDGLGAVGLNVTFTINSRRRKASEHAVQGVTEPSREQAPA
jgi:hypothetical protein